ncbi:hypothetical protein ACHAXR_001120 [Thalassiosira sp. AJA248-18]
MEPAGERSCRGEIRWWGGEDEGLRDIRGDVKLWGLDCEIKLHQELSAMPENKNKTAIEISEEVLKRNLDFEMRKEMYRTINGIE